MFYWFFAGILVAVVCMVFYNKSGSTTPIPPASVTHAPDESDRVANMRQAGGFYQSPPQGALVNGESLNFQRTPTGYQRDKINWVGSEGAATGIGTFVHVPTAVFVGGKVIPLAPDTTSTS